MPEYQVLKITVLEPRKSWKTPAYGELWKTAEDSETWLLGCPACGLVAFLSHDVKIVNGRPTISPSVICPDPGCGAHYFVVNGEVQPC